MTQILSDLVTKALDNGRFFKLTQPFKFKSDVLESHNLKSEVEVPAGFICDFESVPIFRGSNIRGGVAHDYLSRIDSIPVVSKAICAEVYREIMKHCYLLDKDIKEHWYNRVRFWNRRWIKWGVVRVAPGYFHKHKVMATLDELDD